jgi:chromosome partitioning protein
MSVLYELWSNAFTKVVATILTPIILGAAYYLLRRLFRALSAVRLTEAALEAVARRQTSAAWVEGPGFWLKTPIAPPKDYLLRLRASIPILMVATLKGGVGKTTLAANLAAQLAINWLNSTGATLRVLLVDLDFQGSVSTMTVSDASRFALPSKANLLVSGELADGLLRQVAEPMTRPGMRPLSIATVPAYYDLAQAENRTLVEWLLPLSDHDLISRLLRLVNLRPPAPPRSAKDVRYLLAEALLDPQVQANYDLVIIDAPPRLTTAHVQAMCASTHLLIPTISDRLSGDAVARYVDQVATHRLGPSGNDSLAICPGLELIGVIGTMIAPRVDVSGFLSELRASLAAARLKPHVFSQEYFVRQRPPYRRCAGERIAYAAVERSVIFDAMRKEMDKLGDEIAARLGATGRRWVRK